MKKQKIVTNWKLTDLSDVVIEFRKDEDAPFVSNRFDPYLIINGIELGRFDPDPFGLAQFFEAGIMVAERRGKA